VSEKNDRGDRDDRSERSPKNTASPNGKPAAVIRRMEAAEETVQERVIKKHIPAWVVSGAVHVVVVALLVLLLGGRSEPELASAKVINTTAEKTTEEEDPNLTNEDPGLDTRIEAALPEIERLDKTTVDSFVTADPVGAPDMPNTDTVSLTPPGLVSTDPTAGNIGDAGNVIQGTGGTGGTVPASFIGRSGATKSKLVAEGGGNAESERAVALGLAWLARVQMKDGGWEYDQGSKEHRAAATGMALLPFLAAGETHKSSKNSPDNKYRATVERGLAFLMRMCAPSGPNAGRISANMYEQAIATIPLCEAYGMTKDPVLKAYAQAAINYIQRAQGPNGSWGYGAGANGDTSIVGWQVQALKAAQLTKDLVVDDRVIKKAIKFLDFAAGGSRKSMYGYADDKGAQPGTPLTAVGLLSRYYIDAWGPNHPGMVDGVAGLMKHPPLYKGGKDYPAVSNMYYYYYATQVVHFYEGEDWKTWNEGPKDDKGVRKGGMRDWLVGTQNRKDGPDLGSWNPEAGWFGTSCGRVGTTAMVLLTLDVYYRHLPLYKRGADGNADKLLENK
jgi:hypothetical protein